MKNIQNILNPQREVIGGSYYARRELYSKAINGIESQPKSNARYFVVALFLLLAALVLWR